MPTTIAIVEDDAVICEDLTRMIGETGDMTCICSCRNGQAALHKVPKCRPEVIIMDIQLPDISGIECTARIKRLLPETKVLMFTIRDDEDQIFQALEAGADGYLLKSARPPELMRALREITRGGGPMTTEVSRVVVQSFFKPVPAHDAWDDLTPRERDVLEFLVDGHVSKEIATRLFISVQTVNYHLKQIYQKMNVRTRTEAAVEYLRRRPARRA
jgi:DNA-binding NarL/FixJ family response regulator